MNTQEKETFPEVLGPRFTDCKGNWRMQPNPNKKLVSQGQQVGFFEKKRTTLGGQERILGVQVEVLDQTDGNDNAVMKFLKENMHLHQYICLQTTLPIVICAQITEAGFDLGSSFIRSFMNFLLSLNGDKTEVLLLRSRQLLAKVNFPGVSVGDSTIRPALKVRSLGAIFESDMSMTTPFNAICRLARHHIRSTGRIRRLVRVNCAYCRPDSVLCRPMLLHSMVG